MLFSWAAVLHELLSTGSFLQGPVLPEPPAPEWIPHRVLAGNLLQPGLLSAGLQLPAMGSQLPWVPTCSRVGLSMGCRWISAPTWSCTGCRGTAASPSQLHSCSSFSTDLGACIAIPLTHLAPLLSTITSAQ